MKLIKDLLIAFQINIIYQIFNENPELGDYNLNAAKVRQTTRQEDRATYYRFGYHTEHVCIYTKEVYQL
jgi:hypothetical protein